VRLTYRTHPAVAARAELRWPRCSNIRATYSAVGPASMADVFVSCARSDKARVAPLVAAIEAQGWLV
jgi:hypothetical protein